MSYVMFFDQGRGDMKDLLGGKGANLAEMTRLGLPVPAGFTITTEACRSYSKSSEVPAGMWDEVASNLARLEKETGKKLGDPQIPLLISVRSGAKFSMPGMMDTILNLGMNDVTVQRLAEITDNERFAWDSYRRFIQMYGDVVMNVEKHKFEAALVAAKTAKGYAADIDMTAEDWKALIPVYKTIYREGTGADFPQDAQTQLKSSILAVFQSWNNKRAKTYRALNKISDDLGTACNVQTMVFGNMGMDSGTGVGFTRNPATGAIEPFGEFLLNAQGEDVVAGVRTPEPIAQLESRAPEVYHQLMKLTKDLETRLKDMQDFEFTVERGTLYMLQTRNGKRTAAAAVKIACDLVKEGLITKDEALERVDPASLDQLLHPHVKPGHGVPSIAKGLPASPGAATGEVVFTADEAAEIGAERAVILVTPETTPEDIHGLAAARGILTARGGMTSHAAVVARGMGKPSVVGAEMIVVNRQDGTFTSQGHTVKRGEIITIDGASGLVFRGEVPMEQPEVSGGLEELLVWADERKRMKVHANADTPEDAARAREFGATGIGLCRTEHMFFNEDRLGWVRKMIMSDSPEAEKEALDHLLPMQRGDFEGILEAMDGLPVTIRLLDPPLHEFLPPLEAQTAKVATAEALGQKGETVTADRALLARIKQLHEVNPMMGLRGIRLGLTRPNITRMQVRAIAEATAKLEKSGKNPKPEIMIPLVGLAEELAASRAIVEEVLAQVRTETGAKLDIPIGTMIELPRACIVADEIAKYADFFSFGTNDLTQMTFGYSRDDAQGKFIPYYMQNGYIKDDPFSTLDLEGVGALMRMAVDKARATKPNIKLGICGEHGGDPESVIFCDSLGLNYVSCSPFRVPLARLAAARAVLGGENQDRTK